jgi:hypothetical protein
MSRRTYDGVTEQRKAAFKRLLDAEALLSEKASDDWRRRKGAHARGAMYLAGYAIECKLKSEAMEIYHCRTLAQLARKWDVDDRDVYTHGLETMGRRLPFWSNLLRSPVRDDFRGQVNLWRPSWRYDPEDSVNGRALSFIQAVRNVYHWLEMNS